MARIRRKELKAPDEFQTFTGRALEFARQNERQVTVAVLGIAGLLAVALGVRAYRSWQLDHASAALSAAYRELSADHLEAAAAAFQKVRTEWPGTDPARLAAVYDANALADLGKADEAAAVFTALLDASRDPLLRQVAYYNRGLVRQRSGQASAATDDFEAAAKILGPLQSTAWVAGLRLDDRFAGFPEADKLAEGLGDDARAYAEERLRAKRSAASRSAG